MNDHDRDRDRDPNVDGCQRGHDYVYELKKTKQIIYNKKKNKVM